MEYVLPVELHDRIMDATYRNRGFSADESASATRCARMASWHGIKTHNGLKALHLDEFLGSGLEPVPGCVPGAAVTKKPHQFAAAQRWIANRKLGQAVAFEAMEACMKMADEFGVGMVSVDDAFHYLWGGAYVMDAAMKGYIGYTNCTSTLAEVVPFGGRFPTIGTNPHSWGLPTVEAIGFPIIIDWATSVIAMGRVQQAAREGNPLPPDAAVDEHGAVTTDPSKVAALLPFAAHKGYGLGVLNELFAAMIGGSLPTLRGHPQSAPPGEKTTSNFFFMAIAPDALDTGGFSCRRDRHANLKAVIDDVLGHGNESCLLPGQIEHEAAQRSQKASGLLFTEAEIHALAKFGHQTGVPLDINSLETYG